MTMSLHLLYEIVVGVGQASDSADEESNHGPFARCESITGWQSKNRIQSEPAQEVS